MRTHATKNLSISSLKTSHTTCQHKRTCLSVVWHIQATLTERHMLLLISYVNPHLVAKILPFPFTQLLLKHHNFQLNSRAYLTVLCWRHNRSFSVNVTTAPTEHVLLLLFLQVLPRQLLPPSGYNHLLSKRFDTRYCIISSSNSSIIYPRLT